MSFTQTAIGGATLVGVATLIIQGFAPDRTFMAVRNLAYEDGVVQAERTIFYDTEEVDWTVTVFREDGGAPICKTIPGPDLHEGWSTYDKGYSDRKMSLDLWVGHPGCLDLLEPGPHGMKMTWTPRDGSPPVDASLDFSVE